MKKLIALALAVLMVLSLVACATPQENSGKKTIAVIAKGEVHAFWLAVKAGAQKAADEKGYNLTFRGPEGEDPEYVSDQREMLQHALSNNAAGIVLATIGSGFGEQLIQAYDKNIPVVTFDSGLKAPEDITEGKNPIVAHVATDNKAAANINGEMLFEAVKADIAAATTEAPYVIGVIQHDQTSTGTDRTAGFVEKFKALADADATTKGKYKIADPVIKDGPGTNNDNYKLALQSLYQAGIDALFMTNEGVVKQVYDEINAAAGKYDGIVFTGFDAGTKQLTWMKEEGSDLMGSVAQDSIRMGYEAVMQCIAAIEGGKAEDQDIIGTWYDATNLIDMLTKDLAYADTAEDKTALLGN